MSEPQQAHGGWWGLYDVRRQADAEFEWWAQTIPMACPNDGEPLTIAPDTDSGASVDRFCRFCGWQYPRDWNPPTRI